MSKKTIVFDFDGVIHLGYEGWKDGSIYGHMNWALLDYIEELLEDYYVIIEHVPCMQCEQCGEKFFTTSVMERIEFILEKIEKKEESILVLDYDTAA